MDLAAVRRQVNTVARERLSADEGERAAAWGDLTTLVDALVGRGPTSLPVEPLVLDALVAAAATGAEGPRVPATRGVASRDTTAYQLLSLGYSPRETADVVSGRISKSALDTASRMLAVGGTRDAASDYLDRQYKSVSALRSRPVRPVRPNQPNTPAILPGPAPSRGPIDALIERYANLHNVSATIVRAMIMTESAFDPGARSPAGAIGLMQLMPATARELGVNPLIVEQNIEGGVRYFSELLKRFGGLELALVAYNGGPGFARRYARREAALYGETRAYVRKVLASAGLTGGVLP